ncbi:hypothetical protein NPIL_369491 [Nephila pilipes]|uniref:Uncharacterized protein n=1 Tax=Nephila pilipes TaxID=299642 RepID=A0A8X6UUX7_NEPPI|nr:hypothetical protein NPIL_369491 [Nephila pilipes]
MSNLFPCLGKWCKLCSNACFFDAVALSKRCFGYRSFVKLSVFGTKSKTPFVTQDLKDMILTFKVKGINNHSTRKRTKINCSTDCGSLCVISRGRHGGTFYGHNLCERYCRNCCPTSCPTS